jgi:hypothetical protein
VMKSKVISRPGPKILRHKESLSWSKMEVVRRDQIFLCKFWSMERLLVGEISNDLVCWNTWF